MAVLDTAIATKEDARVKRGHDEKGCKRDILLGN